MGNATNFIQTLQKLFPYYKSLADNAIGQMQEEQLFWQPNTASNSVGVIVQHMAGNMLSRFTDFYTSDGEKPWRDRDGEFELSIKTKTEMLDLWEQGWGCLMSVINGLQEEQLGIIVYIRNEGHTVQEALLRQLAHYSSHVGQIIYIAKTVVSENWQTLSIAKGQSGAFNRDKFGKETTNKFFTEK